MRNKRLVLPALLLLAACLCCGCTAKKAVVHRYEEDLEWSDVQMYVAESEGDSYAFYTAQDVAWGSYELQKDRTAVLQAPSGDVTFDLRDAACVRIAGNRYRWYREDGSYQELLLNPDQGTYVMREGVLRVSLSHVPQEEAGVDMVRANEYELWFRDGTFEEVRIPLDTRDVSSPGSGGLPGHVTAKVDGGLFLMEAGRRSELQRASNTGRYDAYASGPLTAVYSDSDTVLCLLEDGTAEISTPLRWNMPMEKLAEGVWGNWMSLAMLSDGRMEVYLLRGFDASGAAFGDTGRVIPQTAENVYSGDGVVLTMADDASCRGYIVSDTLPQLFGNTDWWRGVAVDAQRYEKIEGMKLLYTPGKELGVCSGSDVLVHFADEGNNLRLVIHSRAAFLLDRTSYAIE